MRRTARELEDDIRSRGLQVKTQHGRLYRPDGTPEAKGGLTTIRIITEDGTIVLVTEAFCSPRDTYNKRLGRTIALGRAMKELNEPREE